MAASAESNIRKKSTPQVLMIGPEGQGGIDTIIQLYRRAGFFDNTVSFLASYPGQSALQNAMFFIGFLGRYLLCLLQHPSVRIVHLHSSSRGSFFRKALALAIAKNVGKKTVFHINGSEFKQVYDQASAPYRWLIEAVLRSADVVLAVSSQWQQDLRTMASNPNTHVLFNPTETYSWLDRPEKETVDFLFMGRIGRRKGAYDIVKAAELLTHHAIRIHLYGDGDVALLQERVKAAGLTQRVFVHGWISGSQKAAAFQQADALVLPSYNEGQPLAVLEAMAYGLPVISTTIGGIPDAVTDGVEGYLIEPGDVAALAERIMLLATSAQRRQSMGRAAHSRVARSFSVDIICRQLRHLYDTLCQDSPQSGYCPPKKSLVSP